VLGWCHRRSELHLTLVLPDGTRSLIPAAWTDLRSRESTLSVQRRQAASLASGAAGANHCRRFAPATGGCKYCAALHAAGEQRCSS
jgi:hypothetical protein